ncbi:UvrD-helicase domain-containing protein [Prevotella sp. E9-3]|uniref:3'-5' exonuclease n=1 Tax=Prevotella sp. E9-3 TaxID=2913621 RepID=UPI001EDB4DB7|nr:3'-5' exonuclease [Prevotella sp. E9-3]UKK48896.1 UvrD-helicase domain-containing protein [Prevotella sp. E9-3]
MEFNKEQLEVIQSDGGYHLVLAPPGCGKTAVLAERIVWAYRQGVPFSSMACLTFTNRASRGMRDRIWQRLPNAEGLDLLFVGNVHRFCSQFLYRNGVVAEQTTVIDTDTVFSIIADILGEDELVVLGDNKHRQRYSQLMNLQHLMHQCEHHYEGTLMVHRDALPPLQLKELCVAFKLEYNQQSAIELYRHADFYLSQDVILSREAREILKALETARQYEQYKKKNDLLDFEDLLLNTYEFLCDSAPDSPYRNSYTWLQIDEVQDLNPLQLAIIDLFTAPHATVVYLGDAQQAIFSFMGAKTNTLEMLRERCGEGQFHNFFQNYRSPKYLLDVFNEYGQKQLNISADLLPTTTNLQEKHRGDLVLADSDTNIDEVNLVARMVRRLYEAYSEETTAVVVTFNSDADEVSAALPDIPHFKVSGTDLFSTPDVRLLLAHLSVVAMEQNFIAWSILFRGLRVYSSQSAARQFARALMDKAISPVDLLTYDDSTYVAEFVKAYGQSDFVVFDTETTGLSVFDDDVVQIAAVRVRDGKVVDELNLFIETSRPIPEMLGEVPNPLIEEYAHQPHLAPDEAFRQFVEFARDAEILGHNATYDYQIMEHNMQRYAPSLSMKRLWSRYFDSLKLIRLLKPRLRSYKLKSLLETLGLEGQNSHLANDDIMATLSLVNFCYDEACPLIDEQLKFLGSHRHPIDNFRRVYQHLYLSTVEQLYQQQEGPLLSMALQQAYHVLREEQRVGDIPKLNYILRYIEIDMLTPQSGHSLAEQLSAHMADLSTLKEADLCGSSSITDRVFISTVHKAKGLEFDNVIVFDAVDGKYPSTYGDENEEARKFYVAISRARQRLVITFCHNAVTPWGRWYTKQLTPFMDSIKKFF